MPKLFNDFMLIQRLPDGRERVRIAAKQIAEAELHEGDEVTLIEDDNLQATVRLQFEDGHWYGLVLGAVEDISSSRA